MSQRDDSDSRDDLCFSVGGKLHVVGWTKTAVGHFHDPGVCIGCADAGFLFLVWFLLGFRFRQLIQGGLNPLESLLSSALLCSLHARRSGSLMPCQGLELGRCST